MASPIVDYFFSGKEYITVQRGETGPGKVVSGPSKISDWQWPSGFGANGIDAALYSGSVCFFFKDAWYIQVTRGINGFFSVAPDGKPEISGPFPISNWGWPNGFGATGIDAALWSGTVTYFFKGNQYIRVTRPSDTAFGTTDPQYPRSIYAGWGWNNDFNNGVKGALPSGSRCYFFRGNQYMRVSRGFELGGFIDPGYPAHISPNWGWPRGFGENGIDAALYSGGPLVAPGSLGLSSRYNYVFTAGGKNITGLVLTIRIDNDIVSPTTDNGFSFQLNCESPSSSDGGGLTIAQQFMLDNHPKDTAVFGWVNFWGYTSKGWGETYATTDSQGSFIMPAANTIKAGSVFTIAPVYSNEEVSGCNWTYTDPKGNTSTKSATFTGASIAPITAFTFSIGGSNDGTMATFTSGEGTLTYSASVPLTAQASGLSFETLETSNMVYEELPPAVNVSQLFGVAPAGWKNPDSGDKKPSDRPLDRSQPVAPKE